MDKLLNFLVVGLGGAAGSMLRYGITLLGSSLNLSGNVTTFSTFSMQNVRMLQDGKIGMAAVYIISTVAVCILMAWLGYRLGQSK